MEQKYNYKYKTMLLLLLVISISSHATTYMVTSITDSGTGSLRQAITDANANSGADEIHFNIAQDDCDAAGVCHISVLSDLPEITDTLTLDGSTQAQYGTAPDNVCATQNEASYMRIELNTTGSLKVLTLNTPETSVVKGLSIGGETTNANTAIYLNGIGEHWVNCNHLGVNAEGTEKLKLYTGLCLGCSGVGHNGIIGTNSDGTNDISERNIIAASTGIYHNSYKNYITAGNYFALTADGITGLTTSFCISGRQGSGNRIGSNLDGFADSAERNIFGSCNTAISYSAYGSNPINIAGNWIGVNAEGTSMNNFNIGLNLNSSTIQQQTYLVASNWIDAANDSSINLMGVSKLTEGSTKNCITNTTSGFIHSGTSIDQPFTDNYWGGASGPAGQGPGTGAEIEYTSTGTITYAPWSTNSQICQLNNAPTTTNDSYTLNEDGTLTADDPDGSLNDANDDGVLANDSDADNNVLTVLNPGTYTTTGIGGSITIAADGTFVYTAPADVSGQAGLLFDVSDGINSVASSLSIDVLPVNDAPGFAVLGNIDATNVVGVGNTQIQIANFAHSLVLGPTDENSQNVQQFNLLVADFDAILSSIDIDNNGTLDIDFSLNYGLALVDVTLQDDGGTANGGVDTSTDVEFVVAHFDLIFADGFESGGGFGVFDYLSSITHAYPLNNLPVYDFNSDNLKFYGHSLQLDNDYASAQVMLLVQYWLQAVLIIEDPLGDYDLDGTSNIDDEKPLVL